MKVAFYARSLSHGAGIGRYARSLLNEIAAHSQHEFTVLANQNTSIKFPNVTTIYSQRSNPASILYWEHFKLPGIVRHQAADVFYNPDFVLPFSCPCPGVVTIHDLSFLEMPQFAGLKARIYYGAFIGRTIEKAKGIVTDSYYSKSIIQKHFPSAEKKVTVAYPAADDKFNPHYDRVAVEKTCSRYGIRDNYILYVGLLGGWKNLSGLIRAYQSVCEKMTLQHQLVLAGRPCSATGSIEAEIERSSLSDRIRLLKNVDDDDLPLLYNAASVFAFPSLMEGFGLPPLEAMQCGVPVVCTSAGSLPEVVGDAAWLVPPGDGGALAKAILGMVNTPSLRAAYVARGFEQAKKFSWRRCAQQMLEVFDGVL